MRYHKTQTCQDVVKQNLKHTRTEEAAAGNGTIAPPPPPTPLPPCWGIDAADNGDGAAAALPLPGIRVLSEDVGDAMPRTSERVGIFLVGARAPRWRYIHRVGARSYVYTQNKKSTRREITLIQRIQHLHDAILRSNREYIHADERKRKHHMRTTQ